MGKFIPERDIKASWKVNVSLHLFCVLAINMLSGQHHVPVAEAV
jgi:hypothetical protein